MDKIVAEKNNKAYLFDVFKIVSGSFLTIILIVVILIFRNSIAFVRGKYSLLDFTLLFLLLTVSLFSSGAKGLKNHKKMPKTMLVYNDEKLIVLGDEVDCNQIKGLKGRFEFGHTGIIEISTENKTYKLYGVKEYAKVINSINETIKHQK